MIQIIEVINYIIVFIMSIILYILTVNENHGNLFYTYILKREGFINIEDYCEYSVCCKSKLDIIAMGIWTLLQELGRGEECFLFLAKAQFYRVWGCSPQEYFATLSTFSILQLCPKSTCKKQI